MNNEKDHSLIMQTHTKIFTSPLYLTSGRILEPYQIIYETYGKLNSDNSNAILITHALTGSHHCAGKYQNEAKAGWWDSMVGNNKYIDTNKYFVICANVIGSCYGSTSPISPTYGSFGDNDFYRLKFPVITIQDMVKANKILLNSLGITRLHAVIGGSMGGMQALSFAILYPKSANMFISISASYISNPQIILINKVMREIIMLDSDFKGGNYEISSTSLPRFKGLQVARMLGFSQYLSLSTLHNKFSRRYVPTDGYFELFGRFEVEKYLDYNGANFSTYFDPLCYLYLIRALSMYDASLGFTGLEHALSEIQSPLHLIAFNGDNMFPISEMEHIKEQMDTLGLACSLEIIQSDYGHDSFLVEVNKYGDYIRELLG
ncbi:homoserine O-acetyltransferase [Helicobacter muridarum]|uniref:Homoserine O-acetyltransferase n=1 Tax=Helicobacter muridarum TaxID=216 RepID=A0A377PU45_9HELI|nr:homoserine O-acetyltransferase [Helicobacter muridarum]TLE01073.1 homoserine O-acetyltransferase [Helicobacter muridarum]STQ85924.1 Homoserine O-acetyltransferase [Helicobacter muridarum]